MTRLPRPRVLLLLASVCALVAVTAGVALAAGGRAGTVRIADASTPEITFADRLTLPDGSKVPGHDVVTVRGTKCPKSHPRKIGSSSSYSSTQVNGGPITARSHHSVVCSR
jgi:hypothetical protein